MNVLQILMAVCKSVPTKLDHISAAATVDTFSPAMEGPVWISMNVFLALTVANNVAITLKEEFNVAATLVSSLIVTKELAVVHIRESEREISQLNNCYKKFTNFRY